MNDREQLTNEKTPEAWKGKPKTKATSILLQFKAKKDHEGSTCPAPASVLRHGRAMSSPHLYYTLEKFPWVLVILWGKEASSTLQKRWAAVEDIFGLSPSVFGWHFEMGMGMWDCFPGKSIWSLENAVSELGWTLEGELGPNLPTLLYTMEYLTPPSGKDTFLVTLQLRETSLCCWDCERALEMAEIIFVSEDNNLFIYFPWL